MLSSSLRRLALLAALAAAVSLLAAPASARDGCVALKGTIVGHLRIFEPGFPPGIPGLENHDWDGEAGWYGLAYLQFGQEPPITMLLVDHAIAGTRKDWATGWTAREVLTFKAKDSKETDWFKLQASYVATYRPAPSLHEFHEVGRIAEGAGRYAGAKGAMKIDGLFVVPDVVPDLDVFDAAHDPLLWIAQVSGSYCGTR